MVSVILRYVLLEDLGIDKVLKRIRKLRAPLANRHIDDFVNLKTDNPGDGVQRDCVTIKETQQLVFAVAARRCCDR